MTLNTKYLISPEFSKFYNFQPKLRIAVLASGEGSNFLNLLKLSLKNELDIEIKILITNNDVSGSINKAIKYKIPYLILKEKNFTSKEHYEREIINKLNENEIELVVLAGWMRIITKQFINEFKNRIINIHPSLLPSFKGKKAIQDALLHKAQFTGCSVHYVEEEVDSGRLIIQAALPITSDDNEDSLIKKVHFLEHQILPHGISQAGFYIRNRFKDKNRNDSALYS